MTSTTDTEAASVASSQEFTEDMLRQEIAGKDGRGVCDFIVKAHATLPAERFAELSGWLQSAKDKDPALWSEPVYGSSTVAESADGIITPRTALVPSESTPPAKKQATANAAPSMRVPFAGIAKPTCCERNKDCVRGYKHGGFGGPCRIRPPGVPNDARLPARRKPAGSGPRRSSGRAGAGVGPSRLGLCDGWAGGSAYEWTTEGDDWDVEEHDEAVGAKRAYNRPPLIELKVGGKRGRVPVDLMSPSIERAASLLIGLSERW